MGLLSRFIRNVRSDYAGHFAMSYILNISHFLAGLRKHFVDITSRAYEVEVNFGNAHVCDEHLTSLSFIHILEQNLIPLIMSHIIFSQGRYFINAQ